jgi:hypothetical protein
LRAGQQWASFNTLVPRSLVAHIPVCPSTLLRHADRTLPTCLPEGGGPAYNRLFDTFVCLADGKKSTFLNIVLMKLAEFLTVGCIGVDLNQYFYT